MLSTVWSTERGYLRVYDRSPVDDHVRAGVVSAAFVRIAHSHLFPGQSLHLTSDGHPALLLGHPSPLTIGWEQPRHVAIETVSMIADGLAALHAERILHLDIHIGAVSMLTMMVGETTKVALLDSELARHLDLAPPPGDFAAPHRAPEFATGVVDARADIYGLGVLLHQLVYGDAELAPPPPKRDPFERLLASLLDPNPDRRPSTATDVRAELDRLGSRVTPSPARTRSSDPTARIVVLSPNPEEIAPPITSRWIADTCELGVRNGQLYLTERPLRTAVTAGSSEDSSAPLNVGDVVRIDDLVFVVTTGEANLVDSLQEPLPEQQIIPSFPGLTLPELTPFPAELTELLPASTPVPPTAISPALMQLPRTTGRAEIGSRIGNWQVQRAIAEGGVSRTLYAEHVFTGARAALRKLHAFAYHHPHIVDYCLAEARLIGRLHHPNIVKLIDVGRDDTDEPYTLLEYLDGITCAELLRRGAQLDYATILAFARQIASALGVVHAIGAFHQDLKPENVMYRDSATPTFTLFDFSIAARPRDDHDDDPERDQVLWGTPLYMAPEQVMGQPITERSDLFALGTTLHELATGVNPFVGDDIQQVVMAVLSREPPPIERADLPAGLRELIGRLHAKAPADRPPSTTAVLEALARLPEP